MTQGREHHGEEDDLLMEDQIFCDEPGFAASTISNPAETCGAAAGLVQREQVVRAQRMPRRRSTSDGAFCGMSSTSRSLSLCDEHFIPMVAKEYAPGGAWDRWALLGQGCKG